jgi:hypothetical protein
MTVAEYRATLGKRNSSYRTTEADEQIALFTWIDLCIPREPRLTLAFHPPNGELRDKAVAGRLRAMGVRRGVPDVVCFAQSRGYNGIAIELKVGTNTLTPEQAEWLERLRAIGWLACEQRGWVAAALLLCWYLERKPEDMGLKGHDE